MHELDSAFYSQQVPIFTDISFITPTLFSETLSSVDLQHFEHFEIVLIEYKKQTCQATYPLEIKIMRITCSCIVYIFYISWYTNSVLHIYSIFDKFTIKDHFLFWFKIGEK